MEGFTLVDGIVLVVIVLSAILAYARGLVRESLSIAGWIAAAVAGFAFAPMVEPLMREIPVLARPASAPTASSASSPASPPSSRSR